MKTLLLPALLVLVLTSITNAAVITSSSDPNLAGATIDDFSSYSEGIPPSVSDGIFTMTMNDGGLFWVTDSYNGSWGITGRGVLGRAVTIDFAAPVSAFGIHIGAANVDWTIEAEAFDESGTSLGTSTLSYDVNGFFIGWADSNIGTIVLTPGSSDTVVFDDLHYVVAEVDNVPEPTSLATLGGLASLFGLGYLRRRRKQAA